jgi:hypothetical protein
MRETREVLMAMVCKLEGESQGEREAEAAKGDLESCILTLDIFMTVRYS